MNPRGFYTFGVLTAPNGEPRGVFTTDSAAVFQFVADHSHEPTAEDMYPCPMPLRIMCAPAEASVLEEQLDKAGFMCVGLSGAMGYAILRTTSKRVRRVVVGSLAMAEWLHTQMGERWHTYPSETVRAASGHFGWCFAVDIQGAAYVDAVLSLMGATPVQVDIP